MSLLPDNRPLIKPTVWDGDELKPNRLAGRPHKKNLLSLPRSQIAIYNKIAQRAYEYIKELDTMAHSKNERIRLEALKVLLDKILPNKRAVEIDNKNEPITVKLYNGGFIPPDATATAPNRSDERPTPLQSISLASEGEKNDNSNYGTGEASSFKEGRILAPISNIRRG